MSLYFFNKPEEDKVILGKIRTAHAKVLNKLLGPSQYAWYINRPDPTSWIRIWKACQLMRFLDMENK